MTQSQTSAFSSFPYGGATNGLSIHEREREAARKERQLQNAESVSHSLQLFPQGPRKVQPSRSDRLQHNIQATLGDFKALAPSMSHQKQYSLLGITNKVPQTPVDAGSNNVFSFENNLAIKKENNLDKNAMKNQKMKSQNRTKDEKNRNDLKATSNKKTVNTEQYLKSIKSNNKKTSDSDQNSKETPQVKKASQEAKICTVKKESLSEVSKQEQQVQLTDEKITNIKKESKDTTIKHKPPKLSIKTRSPDQRLATTESTQANVKKILEEMTQPGPPPLTAIQTPRKNNAQFAFPLNPPSSSLLNGSSPLTLSINKKEKEEQILKDLHLTDDENTDDEGNDSSDDSDSSSDSDSDSSSDNSPPNSPVRSKLNKPGKSYTLNHNDNQAAKTSQPPSVTLASSTSSLGDTGEGGVRGDLAAPGAHTSPLNNPLLNADNPANGLSLFEDFDFDLPDISKTMLDEFGSCHDGEGNDLIDPALLAHDIGLCNKDPINHFKPIEKPSEVKLIQPEVHSSKEVENRTKEDSEAKLSKQPKENHEKSSKSTNKRKVSDSSKSNSKSNDSKDESKTKNVDKTSDKKVVKSRVKGSKPLKPSLSDGENEEIDVVTVTDVNNDKGLLDKSDTVDIKNNKTEESSKVSSKTKTTEKLVNGHKEPSVNGHRNSSLNGHHKDTLLLEEKETIDGKMLSLSPKHGLNEEITLDCNSKPDALVVKIPLALLKRIPLLKGINNKMDVESSPPRKPTKHQLSVECSDGKKPRYDHSTKSDSKEGRRHSNSTYNDDYRRKRSPSRENDRYYNKRRRHDSDSSKREKENEKSVHSKMNGWDRLKDPKSPQEHSEVCSCGGKAEAEKRDAWISKVYDPEPRVPHGPDYYLHEAKRVKHRADAIKDHTSKAYKYFESVLNFVNCGKALEQNNDSESRSAYQMYLETVEMLKYAMRLSASKSSQEKKSDKRFIGLCLRLQSLLYMRLFKLKKDSMLKASKTLMDHFKGQPKNSQAPSPYNASNPKTTGTPSPMSPTPSPSGSIGSVGSVGSAGSNEAMTTPSRTSNKPSNCMTSPVNTCIPQKIHSMTVQHLGFTNHMLYGYDTWEQSQMIFNDYRDFFMDLDRNYGPITLQSSIVDVVEYVHQGYLRIQESST